MPDPARLDAAARAICRERCAFMGEPPCYDSAFDGVPLWPNPDCDDPGCIALAEVALEAGAPGRADPAGMGVGDGG